MADLRKSLYSHMSQRWTIINLCFFGLLCALAMRMCLAIAIVEMVIPPSMLLSSDLPLHNEEVLINATDTFVRGGIFNWSEELQGLVLSSFYWGYFFTNIIGGIISDRIGGTYIFEFSITSTVIFTLLTPISVQWGGSTGAILIRFFMGVGEGFMFPGINVLLSKWLPEKERSWAVSWAFSGGIFGSLVGKAVAGAILRHLNSWPAVFYIFGGFGLICSILIRLFCFDKPSDSPFISDAEKAYIEENLKQTDTKPAKTPWKDILCSKPVWALTITNFTSSFGFLPIILIMPKYMKNILHYPVDKIGYLLSITSVTALLCNYVGSWIANKVIVKGLMSTLAVRKIGCTLSTSLAGLFFVLIPYAGTNGALVVTLYIFGASSHVFSMFTIMVNPLDLAPNYAGTLMGLINGAATLGGFISPYLVGKFTEKQTLEEWTLVFWILFSIFIFSNLVFVIFGDAKVQHWNYRDISREGGKVEKCDAREAVELLSNK